MARRRHTSTTRLTSLQPPTRRHWATTYTFDGAGNLLTTLAPGSQLTTNTWDVDRTHTTNVALPSGIVNSMTYNGDGQRVQKQDSSGTTNHIWDMDNILLETSASNIVEAVYTLEPLFYGNLISQSRGGADSFYLFDALGTARQLVSFAGSVTNSCIYDSFGNAILSTGSAVNPFRFVGRIGYYWDSDVIGRYVLQRVYFELRVWAAC